METRPISELKTNPLNPRGEVIVDQSLYELAASIRSHGVLQPILITSDGTIVAGHRRARACEIAEVKEIPIVVRELDESEQIQIMLIENLQRQDLTALQTAKAYQMLCDKGLSIRQISAAIGYRPESISRHLSILLLPAELHSCFDGEFGIPLGGIRYLLELDSPSQQLEFGQKCKDEGWSIGEIKAAVDRVNTSLAPATERQGSGSHFSSAPSAPLPDGYYDDEPTFDEYTAARRVVLFEYNLLRKAEKYEGRLSIASDEMIANIVRKSCAYFRDDSETSADALEQCRVSAAVN